MKLPIVITLGDPAGIGPEIIAKAFRDAPDTVRGCFVAGDVATLRCAAAALQGDSQVSLPVAEIEVWIDDGSDGPGHSYTSHVRSKTLAEVATAATLRHNYQHPTPAAAPGEDTMVRDLADYDRAFGLGQVSQP